MKKLTIVSAALLCASCTTTEGPSPTVATPVAAVPAPPPEPPKPIILPEPEWGPVQTEHYWAGLADGATRTSTAPRMRGADETTAEGILETFGTRYMPNEYDCYRKARETAKEREQLLRENFPGGKPNPADREKSALFDRVEKACAKAVSEMFRRHDELCHFYLLHKLGALSDAELAEVDEKPVLIMLPGENLLFTGKSNLPVESAPPEQVDLDFAAKYLPEINAAYQAEKNLLEESRKLLADLTAEARLLDAPRAWDDSLRLLSGRIEWTVAGVNFYAKCMKENRLAHAIGETTAEALSAFDQTTGANYQKARKDFPMSPMDAWYRTFDAFKKSKRIDEDMFWRMARSDAPLHILQDDMVRIPGKDYMMCRVPVSLVLWDLIGVPLSEGLYGDENWKRYKKGQLFTPGPLAAMTVLNISRMERNRYSRGCDGDACQKFLDHLNNLPVVKKSGIVYRLPTREEWWTAYRAGAKRGFFLKQDGTEATKTEVLESNYLERPKENAWRMCFMGDWYRDGSNQHFLQEWTSDHEWSKEAESEAFYLMPGVSYIRNEYSGERLLSEMKQGWFAGSPSGLFGGAIRLCADVPQKDTTQNNAAGQ